MVLSAHDLQNRGLDVSLVTGTDAFATDAVRVVAVVANGGAAAAVVSLFDATATDGTAAIVLKAAINDSNTLYLGPTGTRFETGLHGSVTGTGASAYVFYVTGD